ncbi:hypothetical protein GWK47_015235 [Chionoecetes opilio]|uniref:Uncharacterized protein n=1 Tax=Chionoecetes opilio TaxID=41210 RepID=A0A8J4XSK4_CHIOP|nr:hypothetical protein GWK47_015235 [Chionoecetes opilio]
MRVAHKRVAPAPLITSIDGPTSSDTGFTGPVCSLLSSVNEMQYNAELEECQTVKSSRRYRGNILVNMGLLTAAQSLGTLDQKAWTDWKELNTLEILVNTACRWDFKLYYDIKVHHRLEDGPKHIITQLRVMRAQAQEGPNSCDLLRADSSMVRTLRMCPPLADGESELRTTAGSP